MFGSDDECSGFAGVYTVKSFKRCFGYAVVTEVYGIQSQFCKQFYLIWVTNVIF